MKGLILIGVFLLTSGTLLAQSWKDSLRQGNEHYKNQNYQQAYESFKEAQKLAPEDVDLSQDIGNAAYRINDYKTAEKAFLSATDTYEDDLQKGAQWHNVGNAQMKEKNYKSAVESYKNALRKNPADEKTRYNLAEAKRRVKQQESQQKKKNQSQESQQNKDDQESQQGDSQQDSGEGDEADNQKEDDPQQGQPSQQNGGSPVEGEGKLSDRKTDRMLDDLLKQEMDTKRKVQGKQSGGKNNAVKSGKRW